MKKYFLTTALMGTFIAPAFGADKIITSANTCTVDVLGVSDNNATANTIATWSLIDYECGAGQYLVKSETDISCQPCPIGSYCPGGTYTVESDTNGANVCPTDYTSDVGAVGENECYIGCELACIQNACPENSQNCTYGTATSNGKQFYGQTACDATPQFCSMDFECKSGYSKITFPIETFTEMWSEKLTFVKNPEDINDMGGPVLGIGCSWDGHGFIGEAYDSMEHPSACQFLKPGQIVYFASDFSFAMLYEVTENEYKGNDLPGAKCSNDGIPCIAYNQNFTLGKTGDNLWIRSTAVLLPSADTEILLGFDNGSINIPDGLTYEEQIEFLLSMASIEYATKIMNNPGLVDDLPQLFFLSYSSVPLKNIWTRTGWEFPDFGSAVRNSMFAHLWGISNLFDSNEEYLDTFFGGIGYCKNNKININWNADNGTENFQGMCYYDQGIALPSDPVKPGYTFTGWKLLENTTTE